MLPGRLGLVRLPNSRIEGDLGTGYLPVLRREYVADTLVSLVPDSEYRELGYEHQEEEVAAENLSISYRRVHLTASGKLPRPAALRPIVGEIGEHLENGLTVVLQAGSDPQRAALFVACVLRRYGENTETAISAASSLAPGWDPNPESRALVEEVVPPEMNSSMKLLDICEAHLRKRNLDYRRAEDAPRLELILTGKTGRFLTHIIVHEKEEQVIVTAEAPVLVPAEKRAAICEYAARVNYLARIGCFEMDMSDGEIRYRASVDVEGGTLTDAMVGHLLGYGVAGMNRHLPAVLSVVYGGISPEDAVTKLYGN